MNVVDSNEKHSECKRAQNETNDCTVLAVASATGLDYLTSHTLAAQAGRQPRRGFHSHRILKEAVRCGWINGYSEVSTYHVQNAPKHGTYHSSSPYPTLAQVLPLLSKGRYVLETQSHAFAVVDGVIYDNRVTTYTRGRYERRTNSGGMQLRRWIPGKFLDKPRASLRQRVQMILEVRVKTEGE